MTVKGDQLQFKHWSKNTEYKGPEEWQKDGSKNHHRYLDYFAWKEAKVLSELKDEIVRW